MNPSTATGDRKDTLYDHLGVEPNATHDQIRDAYRAKAKQTHPDAGGNAEAFGALSHAAAVLTDPARRARYDETGADDPPGQTESEAFAMIIGLLASAASDERVPVELVDMGALIQKALAEAEQETKQQIAKLTSRKARIEKLMKRVKRKGKGPNMIVRSFEDSARKIEGAILKGRDRLEVIDAARKMAADYDFEAPAPAPAVTVTGTTTAGLWARF